MSEPTPRKTHPWLRLGVGFGGVLAVALAVLDVWATQLDVALRDHVARTRDGIAQWESRVAGERRRLSPAQRPGNAALAYVTPEWFNAPRRSWGETPPEGMPTPGLERGLFSRKEDPSPEDHARAAFEASIPSEEAESRGRDLGAELFVESYGPHYVAPLREGAVRETCDWAIDLRLGLGVELPDITTAATAHRLMLLAALAAPAEERGSRLIEGLQVAQDFGLLPTVMGYVVSAEMMMDAIRAILAALRRGLPAASRAALAEALAAPLPSMRDAVWTDNLQKRSLLCASAGELLAESGRAARPPSRIQRLLSPYEFDQLEAFQQRLLELVSQPVEDREAAMDALLVETEATLSELNALLIPDLVPLFRMERELLTLQAQARAALRAIAYHEREGRWPAALSELEGASALRDWTTAAPSALTVEPRPDGSLALRAADDLRVPACILPPP